MMPGLSGIDVLRKMRADERLKDLAVILLSAKSRDIDVDTGFASGRRRLRDQAVQPP